MDARAPLPFPRASLDPIEHELVEVDAAIDLVAGGFAARIQLVGLIRPEGIAPSGLAHAQRKGVRFSLDRGDEGAFAVTVGPRLQGSS